MAKAKVVEAEFAAAPVDAVESEADRKLREAVAERKAALAKIIAALPRSCSHDLDAGAVFGRMVTRLREWGATDVEIAENMTAIREAADGYTSKRDAALAEIALTRRGEAAARLNRALNDIK
jgi:putative heme iron utilization protein